MRRSAAGVFERFGPDAKSALPVPKKLAKTKDDEAHDAADRAIAKISG